MKILRGSVQASGYWIVHLVDPEDLDLLRFEETGAMPEGMDFAVWWDGEWREGRCYDSSPRRTFVTYKEAQRLPLQGGMRARMPLYVLHAECLLELAQTYVQELGYTPLRDGVIVGTDTSISSGESAEVAVPVGYERPPVVIAIKLYTSGDIHLVTDTETFYMLGAKDALQ
jgi:hypothetical protein